MEISQKKNILIIDDDATIRKIISFHLRKNDFNTIEADGPEQAFEALKNNPVNLVFCDVTMDEMDGFTFCRKVKEHEEYRLIPFVFVTAKNTNEDKSLALDAGGDDIITKPFDVHDILLKAQSLIRRSEIFKSYSVKKNLAESFTHKTARILLVDDDQTLSKLFKHNLEKAGFECEAANSVTDAMNLLQSFKPDLIISDIMMPVTDGHQFRKKLLDNKDLASIPFVFLTSKDSEADILQGFDLDIQDYVLKTAGPKIVVAKVSAIIKRLGIEREKIVTELHSAAGNLRAKVVPDNSPEFNGFNIQHWHVPYEGIPGGDFIDYFSFGKNKIAIILGDVMGKKWGAWYFAFAYAGYVRSSIRVVLQNAKDLSPSLILDAVNNSVYQDSKVSEVFTTLSVIVIDNETDLLQYSGAGDLPIIIRKKSTGDILKIQSRGMLLGFSPNGDYKDEHVKLESGDAVLLISDGILETRNSAGEQFGYSRLEKLLSTGNTGTELINDIKTNFSDFAGNRFEDDISLICITK